MAGIRSTVLQLAVLLCSRFFSSSRVSQTYYLSHSQSKICTFNLELIWCHKTLLLCKELGAIVFLLIAMDFILSFLLPPKFCHLWGEADTLGLFVRPSLILEGPQVCWHSFCSLGLFQRIVCMAAQCMSAPGRHTSCSTGSQSAPVWILWLSVDGESELWGQNRKYRETSVPNTFHVSFDGIDHFIEKQVWIIVLKDFPFEMHILTF